MMIKDVFLYIKNWRKKRSETSFFSVICTDTLAKRMSFSTAATRDIGKQKRVKLKMKAVRAKGTRGGTLHTTLRLSPSANESSPCFSRHA